ncbi:MAG: peptidoglycan editing factor PgeF [Pseudomonadota bacterium]
MGLTPIQTELFKELPHGFFTREGGVSNGIYDSLNGGQGSRDQSDAVQENRYRITKALGAASLHSVHQIHSDIAVQVTTPWSEKPRADAMVTMAPGQALGILTADCAPVLFADREAGVIGAAHAGWKGALGGVLEATIRQMRTLGAENITAVIGPCISQRNYEVGPEFFEKFTDEDPENDRFFVGGTGDRMHFDLPGFALMRLRAAGVKAEWTGHCTYGDERRFFSFRRATHRGEPDYGRLVAAISLDV